MITWAVAYIIVKRDPWKPEGTGMTVIFAMIADVCLAYNIFQ